MEIAFDKVVNFTIHDSLDISCAVVCSVVFNQCIWLEYIGADLATPSNVLLCYGIGFLLLFLLLLIILIKLSPQHLEGYIFIHVLASFILTLNYNTGGIVCDSYGRVCLVDMLSTCTAGPVCIESIVFRLDFNLYIVIYLG